MLRGNSFTVFKERKLFAYINQFPKPSGYARRLIITNDNVYTEEDVVEEFVSNEKNISKIVKLGCVNNGFTFFNDRNYSTRIITKRGETQAIELYVQNRDKVEPIELEIPLIYEERFRKTGSLDALLNAFQNHYLDPKDN